MCGIFALLNNISTFQQKFVEEQFVKGEKRGPEFSKLQTYGTKCVLGFHRLAINGLNNVSNQPIIIDNIALICNGEIYNYQQLYKMMKLVEPKTQSDCEVIIHLYKQYGMKQTLQMIDGVFSFVLYDTNTTTNNTSPKIYVARDPYGVRPLYILKSNNSCNNSCNNSSIYGFASEMKVLTKFNEELGENYTIEHFQPGTYSKFLLNPGVEENNNNNNNTFSWNLNKNYVKYHTNGFTSTMIYYNNNYNLSSYTQKVIEDIQFYLYEAVKKRTLVTERPIACLLSGGLDSSLITAIVNDCYKTHVSNDKPLETFSIGLEGSEDLKYARIVADYLGTKHTEILLSEKDFIDAIPEVIYAIESYDTTSVRASIGNYLLGKYIAAHSDAKVIFNGDGSDELCGGYLYMHAAPNSIEFDKECRRLLKNIHAFDVLRSDKCISSHGLEPRTPFLDRTWVQKYLGIHPDLRYHPGNKQCEKYLLRRAFSKEKYVNSNGQPLLPDCVLWRTKEAFSDGVSKTTRSLYEIIQESIPKNESKVEYTFNNPDTDEKYYYRTIFEKHYPGLENVVPYFWMPRYIEAKDASARTLAVYKEIHNNMV